MLLGDVEKDCDWKQDMMNDKEVAKIEICWNEDTMNATVTGEWGSE